MLKIIHGDDLAKSRTFLNQQISKYQETGTKEIIRLDGEKINLTELLLAAETKSLFAEKKLVIIENLFTRTKSKLKDKILNYLISEKHTVDILLWEKKKISTVWLKKFSQAQISEFKINQTIFKFLDSLSPTNIKQSLHFFQLAQKNDPPELIFYLLHRRVSELIIAKDSGSNGLLKKSPWQKSRLLNQASKFSLPELKTLHRQLYRTDVQVKSGKNLLPLASELDLILSGI